jgi:15-cis-phytoene synthase
MKSIFDQISHKSSRIVTHTYSTSFSLGILFLDRKMRRPIRDIYGFVRFADEIVDSFEGYDQEILLEEFTKDTFIAIERKISLNPILNSFQQVVNEFNIDYELIHCFLRSMKMDLLPYNNNQESYEDYILGSAEVVGLMCLKVFCNGSEEQFQELKPSAMKLGAAFQKVNFLRDAKDDFEVLGRTYFPEVNMNNFSAVDKKAIERDIDKDFQDALVGIKQLPTSSRKGVYLAYIYYLQLYKKIRRMPANKVLEQRTRIPNVQKLSLMFYSLVRHELNIL